MESKRISSLDECNTLLKNNTRFANGKNFRVGHLYATGANSRWQYENLWGIYLAKPNYAWMALWIAITSRGKLQKRRIRYHSPQSASDDFVGSVGIFNPDDLSLDEVVCREAYLYLFDPVEFKDHVLVDISGIYDEQAKFEALLRKGFEQKTLRARGKSYDALAHPSKEPIFVDIDRWQVALVNTETSVPQTELILTKKAIEELSARIQWLKEEVGEDYLV